MRETACAHMRLERPVIVSVVVPLHNMAAYIERAIQSIFAQTVSDFEVIVVDDGSTDNGGEVVRRFGDPRVGLIVQHHAGVSVARNRGLEEARAEWVAFLDADDEWLPPFLERTLSLANAKPNLAAVFANFTDAVTDVAFLGRVAATDGVVDDYFQTALNNDGYGMWTSATLVRRDALRACGGFLPGVTWGQDRDAWGRLAWTAQIGYVPETLAVYHTETPESATKRLARTGPQHPAFVRSYREWRAAGRIPSRLLDSSGRFARLLLRQYFIELLHSGDKAAARKLIREEGRLEPRWISAGMYLRLLVPTPLLRRMRQAKRRFSGAARSVQAGFSAGPLRTPTRRLSDRP